MLAVVLGWSVGYEDLPFPFLAGSLRDVEGTLLAAEDWEFGRQFPVSGYRQATLVLSTGTPVL
ncbi:hypothetical protein Taro_034672, partial [Colocasia esculenta]|nr:hypothetical protein [Colocasia esculenta]